MARGRARLRVLARVLNLSARTRPFALAVSAAHARLYRASRGRLIRRWFGTPVLVLETTGRRTGRVRHTPVIYARDGDRFVVSPANAGTTRVPHWWRNLEAAGGGAVHLGGTRIPVRAVEAAGAERERLWGLLLDVAPAIAEYERFTDRTLPVAALEPVDPPGRTPAVSP